MFSSLSERLQASIKKIRGQGRLSEENIQETLRDIRRALLEADVAVPVVKRFIDSIREKYLGQDVAQSLTPGQELIKIVQEELTSLLGRESIPLNFRTQPPAIILIAGLQGVGKTTTVGKLAKELAVQQKKKVMVVSADIYRPAARDQLEILAEQVGVRYCKAENASTPVAIAESAVAEAKRGLFDVLLVDTAGRLHVDSEMMDEIKSIHSAIQPIEVLLATDSQAGQDAVNSAEAFNNALPLTGLVMTKVDGDARGGAILSVREVTGCPIKYLTTGEQLDKIEVFHPNRVASRILGMGDMMSLIEEIERKVEKKPTEKLHKGFGLVEMRTQLKQMLDMGGASSLMGKIPGMGNMLEKVKNQVDDRNVKRQIAMIDSMTPLERRDPTVIRRTRKIRIATGSGTTVQMINQLLKQYQQMNGMMKKMKNPKQAKRMLDGLGGMGGGMPRF